MSEGNARKSQAENLRRLILIILIELNSYITRKIILYELGRWLRG